MDINIYDFSLNKIFSEKRISRLLFIDSLKLGTFKLNSDAFLFNKYGKIVFVDHYWAIELDKAKKENSLILVPYDDSSKKNIIINNEKLTSLSLFWHKQNYKYFEKDTLLVSDITDNKDKKLNYVITNRFGQVQKDSTYDDVGYCSKNLYYTLRYSDKYNYINSMDNNLKETKIIFLNISNTSKKYKIEKIKRLLKNAKYGFVNHLGEILSYPKYHYIEPTTKEGFCIVGYYKDIDIPTDRFDDAFKFLRKQQSSFKNYDLIKSIMEIVIITVLLIPMVQKYYLSSLMQLAFKTIK